MGKEGRCEVVKRVPSHVWHLLVVMPGGEALYSGGYDAEAVRVAFCAVSA